VEKCNRRRILMRQRGIGKSIGSIASTLRACKPNGGFIVPVADSGCKRFETQSPTKFWNHFYQETNKSEIPVS
jgi:hypothetical protein